MNTILKFKLAALLCTFMGAQANAGVIIEQAPKKIAPAGDQIKSLVVIGASDVNVNLFPKRRRLDVESYVTERLTQSGEKPFNMPVVRGVGRNVALRESLSQILPVGWKVFTDGPIDTAKKFNWSGEKTWVLILHSILESNSLHGYIDWTNREITLFNPKKKLDKSDVSVAEVRENRQLSETDVTRIAEAVAAKTKPTPSVTVVRSQPAPTLIGTPTVVSSTDSRVASISQVAPIPPAEIKSKAVDVKQTTSDIQVQSIGGAAAAPSVPVVAHEAPRELIKLRNQIEVQAPILPPAAGVDVHAKLTTPPIATVIKTVPVQAPVQVRQWLMSPEKTVKENLEDWISKEPGWRLVWSARTGDHIYDYSSKPFIGYAFKGELLGKTGAIARVVASFAESNPPLSVEFFLENKVIEISVYKKPTEPTLSPLVRDGARAMIDRK